MQAERDSPPDGVESQAVYINGLCKQARLWTLLQGSLYRITVHDREDTVSNSTISPPHASAAGNVIF